MLNQLRKNQKNLGVPRASEGVQRLRFFERTACDPNCTSLCLAYVVPTLACDLLWLSSVQFPSSFFWRALGVRVSVGRNDTVISGRIYRHHSDKKLATFVESLAVSMKE